MDRVTKDISVFDGMVTMPDADNINSNNAIQSFNIDNNSHLGRLKGKPMEAPKPIPTLPFGKGF